MKPTLKAKPNHQSTMASTRIWSPVDREEFITKALECEDQRGQCGHYNFRVYPKSGGTDNEDPKRSAMTDALARTIFEKDPKYRMLGFKFYEMLVDKIRASTFVSRHFMSTFYILVKGSTAYRMLLGDDFKEHFQFSDLDLVIYINPFVDDDLFTNLRSSINSILLQVISQYKRILDHMLFLNKATPEWFLDGQTIAQFKKDLAEEFERIDNSEGKFLTPFENDEVRNACSKNSFVLQDSRAIPQSVVRIEVPHYDKCERIPLRRTPLLASHNSSISFARTVATATAPSRGEFDLYRLKFTGIFVGFDEESADMYEEKISADFIDVSVPNKNDAELLDFWAHGRCMNIYDKAMNMWVVVPDLPSCARDLYKMLYVYECPESKKEKRLRRYNIMNTLCAGLSGGTA